MIFEVLKALYSTSFKSPRTTLIGSLIRLTQIVRRHSHHGSRDASFNPLSTCFICLRFVWTSVKRLIIVFHDRLKCSYPHRISCLYQRGRYRLRESLFDIWMLRPGAFVSRYNWYNCREACPQSWVRLNSSPSLSTGWWESKLHQWLLGVAPETSTNQIGSKIHWQNTWCLIFRSQTVSQCLQLLFNKLNFQLKGWSSLFMIQCRCHLVVFSLETHRGR